MPEGAGDAELAAPGDGVVAAYRLGRRVGSDVYGDIFVGSHDGGRDVVTLLHDRLVIDVLAARRFATEVAVVADLTAWGIIPTLAFDFETQPRWIATASASGQLLRQRVEASGPLQPAAVRLLASQLARALQALHARGVIQRDLSPDSVLLGSERASLWHSGWAGLLDGSEYAGTSHTEHVEWMAPEQFTGDPSGPASDVHAWAVTVLYAATGHNPFEADKAAVSVSRLMRDTPLIPAGFDPVLASLIAGALSKDPRARPTARDLLTFLDPGTPPLEPMPAAPTPAEQMPPATMSEEPVPDERSDLSDTARPLDRADDGAEVDDDELHADVPDADSIDVRADEEPTWPGEDDAQSQDGGRRVGLAPLVGLAVVVVAAGAALGVFIGRALGG